MINIYDNGDLMLGQVSEIKKYNDMLFKKKEIDEEVWNELARELTVFDDTDIITIDYCGYMGQHDIKRWCNNDIINKEVF